MASDFSVAWQCLSKITIFLDVIKSHTRPIPQSKRGNIHFALSEASDIPLSKSG
jgi:hypothetical protein